MEEETCRWKQKERVKHYWFCEFWGCHNGARNGQSWGTNLAKAPGKESQGTASQKDFIEQISSIFWGARKGCCCKQHHHR